MRISSCSIRRYTIGELPKDRKALVEAIAEINNGGPSIDEYEEGSLFRLFEDFDDILYFDGPEFDEGAIDLELEDGRAISIRELIQHGATVRSLENVSLNIFHDHHYCCTDQQGYGEIDYLPVSQEAERLINEIGEEAGGEKPSASLAKNLIILTKVWSSPWVNLTMFLGVATQGEVDPDYKDSWGDGSYSMDVGSEEGSIYEAVPGGWQQKEESQILSLLEASGIGIAEWRQQASQREIDAFETAISAGGYGFGLVPFIQKKLGDYSLFKDDLERIRSESCDAATITACFAHALSYEPISIKLPAGCKYFLEAYSPSDGVDSVRPLAEQYLRQNIDVCIEGINFRDKSDNLRQYPLTYKCTECMVDFTIERNQRSGGCVVELRKINISVPPIETYELQEKSFEEISDDETYKSSLQNWLELRDAASRAGCVDIVGIGVRQTVEFSWLKV